MSEGIVTGEGVLLETRAVSFATRLLGGLLDATVTLVVLQILTMVAGLATLQLGDDAAAALMLGSIVLALVVIPVTFETLTRGRSIGKLATGVRIVRDDGGPVRFRQAFIRTLVGIGELWLTAGSVAVITSMLHPRSKRVGDVLAGTYAVRVRAPRAENPPVVMPPHLVGWARTADMRRLPDGLALACRQFLARAVGLHVGSRVAMGTSLANELSRHVAPPPPPGTHPEDYLAAVLAERRDREYAAAVRSSALRDSEALVLHRLPHAIADPT